MSHLRSLFQATGSMSRFMLQAVPDALRDLKKDLAWWHTTMMDFVTLNTDPNHPQIHNWLGLTLLEKDKGHVALKPDNATCQKRKLESQTEAAAKIAKGNHYKH